METKSERFVSLDLLRGLAAIGVIVHHVYLWSDYFKPLTTLVDFFFVLSGFVLFPLYPDDVHNKGAVKQFLAKRAMRFFPMCIFALVVTILIGFWLGENQQFNFANFAFACLLLQMLNSNSIAYITPLWSLSAEWLSNICALPLMSQKRQKLFLFGIGLGLVCIIISYLFNWSQFSANVLIENFGGFGRALFGFMIGAFVRLNYQTIKQLRIFNNLLVVIFSLLLSYSALYLTLDHRYLGILVAAPLYVFTVVYFANRNQSVKDSFFHKPAIVLGNLSFGIYVWGDTSNGIYQRLVTRWNVPTGSYFAQVAHIIGITALAIVATLITQKFVERPIQKLVKKPTSHGTTVRTH